MCAYRSPSLSLPKKERNATPVQRMPSECLDGDKPYTYIKTEDSNREKTLEPVVTQGVSVGADCMPVLIPLTVITPFSPWRGTRG